MKSIISSGTIDFIIEESSNLVYDENGEKIAGEKEGTVKQKGAVKQISMFVQTNDTYNSTTPEFTRVYLSASDIKTLYSKIYEIESKEFEAEYDELPW